MSALAIDELVFRGPARPSMVPDLTEEVCSDCGRGLVQFEDARCTDCADLALHVECGDCGRLLRDADLSAGVCSDCLA